MISILSTGHNGTMNGFMSINMASVMWPSESQTVFLTYKVREQFFTTTFKTPTEVMSLGRMEFTTL